MFIDAQNKVSASQAVTADAASTNSVDLGSSSPARQIGTGEPMALVFFVEVAADATTGDETYEFQLIQSANADLSSPDVLLKTDTAFITRATLVAGSKVVIPFPPGLISKRYVGGYYNVGGTTPSITCSAVIMPLSMVETRKDYANGYTVG